MEEVNNRANLIPRHVRSQNKSLQLEFVQKQFNPVRLNHIFAHDNSFPLQDGQFDKREQKDVPVQILLTHYVQMANRLKHGHSTILVLLIFVEFDQQSLFTLHKSFFNFLELLYFCRLLG